MHTPASSILIRAKSMGHQGGTRYLDTADNKSSAVGFIRQAPYYLWFLQDSSIMLMLLQEEGLDKRGGVIGLSSRVGR